MNNKNENENNQDNILRIRFSNEKSISYNLLKMQIDEINEAFERFKETLPQEYSRESELNFQFESGSLILSVGITIASTVVVSLFVSPEDLEKPRNAIRNYAKRFAKTIFRKKKIEKETSLENVEIVKIEKSNNDDTPTRKIKFSNDKEVILEEWMYKLITNKKNSNNSKEYFDKLLKDKRDVEITTQFSEENITIEKKSQEFLSRASFYDLTQKEVVLSDFSRIKGKVLVTSAATKIPDGIPSKVIWRVKIDEYNKTVKPIFAEEAEKKTLLKYKHDSHTENPYMICDYHYKITKIASEVSCELIIKKIHSYHKVEEQDLGSSKKEFHDLFDS